MLGKRLVTPTRALGGPGVSPREEPADNFDPLRRPPPPSHTPARRCHVRPVRKTGEKYGPGRAKSALEQKEPRRSRYRAKVLHV